jgi:hypothetical protein
MSAPIIPKEKAILNTTNLELKKQINYLYANFYKFKSPEDRMEYIKTIRSKINIYPVNELRDDKIYTTYNLQSDTIQEI